jgi:hypothetical protein
MRKPRMTKNEKQCVNSVIELAFSNPKFRNGNKVSIDLEAFHTLSESNQNKFMSLIYTKTR